MAYRLLALDLDGTLLRGDGSIDPRDLAAVAELQAAEVVVTIATGRMRSGSVTAARACGIDGAIACVEGSHLTEVASGRTLARHAIDPDVVDLVRDDFRERDLAAFVFDAEVIHHDARGERFVDYISVWSPNLRVVEDGEAWACRPLATVAIGEPEQVAAARAALAGCADRVFAVSFAVRDCPEWHALLVKAAGTNKGTALAELCRLSDCSLDEAVAVGDWINDVPMFEVAGRSFVMGSAPDAVRGAASDVLGTSAGAGGGIAEAIRRAWG